MNMASPPRVPTWLLERFRADGDSVVGDLVEEYEAGRSRRWYWTQSLSAVAIGLWTDIRLHKALAARAVLTGWAVLFLFSLVLWSLSLDLVGGLLPLRWHVFLWSYPPGLQVLLTGLGCIVYACSGWVVAKLHRRRRVAMLLVYVISLTFWRFPGFGTVIVSHHRPNYFDVLLVSSIVLLLNSVSILLGGYLGSRNGGRPPGDGQAQSAKVFPRRVQDRPMQDGEGTLSLPESLQTVHL